MWKRCKDLQCLTIIKYYFIGIVAAVIVYQFVTNSIINHKLSFSSFIEKETFKHMIATLIGGFVGGFVFILMSNKTDRLIKEKIFWENIKNRNTQFFIRNLLALSIAGFTYKLIGNFFDLESYDNFIQILFSRNFIIEYVGMIFAMIVFSILISVGIKKRLHLLYGK